MESLLIVEERLHLLLVPDAGPLAGLLERRLLAEDLEGRPNLLVVFRKPSGGLHVEAERLIVVLLEGAVFQLGAPRVAPGEELVKVGGVNLGLVKCNV